MSQTRWRDIRDRKLADITSRIPSEWLISISALPPSTTANVVSIPRSCGILSPKEIHITEAYTARGLSAALRNCDIAAVEVTTAFCKRAAIANQLTSCLTEPLFQSALARASYLDEHLATTGQVIGPLHGLPISIKDSFHIAGYDSTVGIASLCHNPAIQNAPLVDLLLSAGAIIHCKTNTPQAALAIDSVNNTYGRVLNPQNRLEWTAGGSSGGEAVLVKMRGSVFGIGTDAGGSIRIPAMCNGLVGFKPSGGRVPAGGQESGQLPAAGKVGLEAVVGPIAERWDDVALFFEAVEQAKTWEVEQEIVPGRWWSGCDGVKTSKEREKKMTIGVIRKDGVTEPLPSVRRVLEEVALQLKRKGIEVVEVDAKRFKDCQSLANKFFAAEGGNHLMDNIEKTGEPLIPWLAPRMKRRAPISLDKLRDLMAQQAQLQKDFLPIWKTPDGRTVDAIICPMAPHPVPPLDRWNTMSYTSAFVMLDYPAASLPVRAVNSADLEEEMVGKAVGSWDKANRELWDKKTVNRDAYLGSPLAVQVVAPRLQERQLYDALVMIDGVIKSTERATKL